MNNTMFHKKVTLTDVLYALIGIWVVAFMLSASMLSADPVAVSFLGIVFICIRLLLIGLAFVDLMIRRQSKKRMLQLVLFTAFVTAEYLIADNWLLFELFFIFIFWADRLDYRKILKIFLYTTGISILFIALLHFAGLLIDYDYFTTRMDRPRVSLGFHHPNSLSECIMVVMLCAFLLYWKKGRRMILLTATALVSLWIKIYPNTLAVYVTLFFVYVIYGFLNLITSRKLSMKQKRIILILSGVMIIAVFAGLYYIVYDGRYDYTVLNRFESLYIRIRLSRQGLERYGITLFGTVYESATEIAVYVNQTANDYFTIDSIYFLLPIRYGIISTVVFFYCYIKSIYYCVKKNDLRLTSVLVAVLIMGIVDPFVTNYIMSFMFICSKARMTDDKKIRALV